MAPTQRERLQQNNQTTKNRSLAHELTPRQCKRRARSLGTGQWNDGVFFPPRHVWGWPGSVSRIYGKKQSRHHAVSKDDDDDAFFAEVPSGSIALDRVSFRCKVQSSRKRLEGLLSRRPRRSIREYKEYSSLKNIQICMLCDTILVD